MRVAVASGSDRYGRGVREKESVSSVAAGRRASCSSRRAESRSWRSSRSARLAREHRGRQRPPGDLAVPAEQAQQRVAVDRPGQSLAHADVPERRALVVDREIDEVETGLGVDRQLRAAAQRGDVRRTDRRRDVRGSAGERLDERGRVGEASELQALDAGRPAPVSRGRLQLDETRAHGVHAERPGPHRRVSGEGELARALDHELRLRQRRQQRGVGALERDLHQVRAESHGSAGEAALASQVLEVRHDRVRVERRAVLEADSLAQREGPDPLVGRRPGGRQHALGVQRPGAHAHQRLAHVGEDLEGHDVVRAVRVERRRVGQRADHELGRRGREREGEDERAQCGRPARGRPPGARR